MKRSILLVGVLLLIVSVAGIAENTSASNDEFCASCQIGAQKESELLLTQDSGEQMEWVCETYRWVVCLEYDTEPCPWCVIPCAAACNACGLIPEPRLAATCYTLCIAACAAGCPECEYCTEYTIEEATVCGWVPVE
jgi:hypothetical protein